MDLYAHTDADGTLANGQKLSEHLSNVANTCAAFARSFGYEEWGYVLGLLHDAGKASAEFQQRLAGDPQHVDHSTAGVKLCKELYGGQGVQEIVSRLLALAVGGHHGGMPNVTSVGRRTPLRQRMEKLVPEFESGFYGTLMDAALDLPSPQSLEPLPPLREDRRFPTLSDEDKRRVMTSCSSFSLQLLGRMLYSCLVDADYLDTERFVSPETAALRNRSYDSLERLIEALEHHMQHLAADAPNTPVNRARHQILEDCMSAAEWDGGLFTLTVPTGGGKTLSSLYFALRHAVLHGCTRVIYAIPFTSVATQTAEVFRSVFGMKNVLEHHSAHVHTENDDAGADGTNESVLSERLATQNWDAPIIVTTNVQLLESLYANTPSKCRKLHNIAGSVIVLDEAQTLPDALLMPTLAMLEDLCIDFGASVVLCSATQPALSNLWPFGTRPREIYRHPEEYAQVFSSRVRFTPLEQIEPDGLAQSLTEAHQVLCVVGTKSKARSIYNETVQAAQKAGQIVDGVSPALVGFFHLSTNMVAAHRMSVLNEIRRRLATGERCVVISTQLIEAGVDVDFPEAYREIAGMDSLMQVAGRCNREGRLVDEDGLPTAGKVHIFELDDRSGECRGIVRTWLESMKSITRNLLADNEGVPSDKAIEQFFRMRYYVNSDGLDKGGIYKSIADVLNSLCASLEYERYADEYQIIDDSTEAVYVAWDEEGRQLLDRARELASIGEAPVLFMALQRYAISVYKDALHQLKRNGDIEDIGPFHVLIQDACMSRYSEETGLLPAGEGELNSLVI